jgi:hypothetical protein
MARTYSSKQPMFTPSGGRVRGASHRRVMTVGQPPRTLSGPAPIVIIVAIIALLVACWVLGKGCITSQEALQNDQLKVYASDSNKILEHSAATATSFSSLANGVGSVAKEDANKQLSDMATDCKLVEKDASSIKVAEKATSLQPLAQFGYKLRAQGVEEYRTGVMALIGGTDKGTATASIQNGLRDLVVSDEVLGDYRALLDAKLKASKQNIPVTDPGRFVASLDSASTASINSYAASIAKTATGSTPAAASGAANPSDAMKAYLKAKDIDTSSMTFSVVATSSTDPNWKIDVATESGGSSTYFLLHNASGTWAVVDSGSALAAEKMKSEGAPADLKAVP